MSEIEIMKKNKTFLAEIEVFLNSIDDWDLQSASMLTLIEHLWKGYSAAEKNKKKVKRMGKFILESKND